MVVRRVELVRSQHFSLKSTILVILYKCRHLSKVLSDSFDLYTFIYRFVDLFTSILKMAPTSRIILTRHAQAEHNVGLDYSSKLFAEPSTSHLVG